MKIISLGSNCEVGFFIKHNFSSSEYYPFDWIWSNIDFVINTFENDYFEFTDCEKLNAVWVPPHQHTYIFNNNCNGTEDRICSAVSVHDADFHQQPEYILNIPKINEKYKRRFTRLYNVLNSNENVILIRKVLDTNQGAIKKTYDSAEKLNRLSMIFTKFPAKITLCIVDSEGTVSKNNLNKNILMFTSLNELRIHLKKLPKES